EIWPAVLLPLPHCRGDYLPYLRCVSACVHVGVCRRGQGDYYPIPPVTPSPPPVHLSPTTPYLLLTPLPTPLHQRQVLSLVSGAGTSGKIACLFGVESTQNPHRLSLLSPSSQSWRYSLPPCFHFLIAGGLLALLKVRMRYGLPPCFHFLIAGGLPALLKVGM
ncbi:unnamed protein product, partial [Closterium sp. Naga37s-1]